jgi:hypothetical protein
VITPRVFDEETTFREAFSVEEPIPELALIANDPPMPKAVPNDRFGWKSPVRFPTSTEEADAV